MGWGCARANVVRHPRGKTVEYGEKARCAFRAAHKNRSGRGKLDSPLHLASSTPSRYSVRSGLSFGVPRVVRPLLNGLSLFAFIAGTFSLPASDMGTPSAPAQATDGVTLNPPPVADTPAPSLMDQDTMSGDWGGMRKKLAEDGATFTPVYTGEVFGNPSGGMRQGVIYDGAMNVAVDFDLERMSGGAVTDLAFHANAVYTHGTSLSQAYVGDFSNTSSIAFYNSLRLQELWLEKWFWNKRLSIRVGNMSADSEFFLSSNGSLFLSGTFGTFNLVALNVPDFPGYPLASPGVRLELLPTPNSYVMTGVYGLDNDSSPSTNNQYGTRFAMAPNSGVLVLTEAGYLLNQGANDHGLQGTYRLGSFVDTGNHDTWASRADEALHTGSLQGAGASYGIYGVIDQQLYTKDKESISGFICSGGSPANTNFIDFYVDGGFDFTGFIPGRPADVAGAAIARSHVSRDFSDDQIRQGGTPFTAETVLEATYKIQLAPWWTVQPDFQYIVTPGGEKGIPNATVLGLRTTVAF